MKYLEGDIVWVPHTVNGYSKGKFIGYIEKNQATVLLLESNEEIKINEQLIQNYNQSDDKDFSDMVEIQDLSEAIILNNLNLRYKSDQIYTYIGNVLISINPYKEIKDLYSSNSLNKYKDINTIKSNPPHIYAVALRAYQSMVSEKKNQSIIISGESGSGKTEASKTILQYLINTSNNNNNNNSNNNNNNYNNNNSNKNNSNINNSSIEKDILNSNPILEAFGNSRTTKNHNSSRFGKFLKIEFRSSDMKIDGASVETYLLEKSRISHRPDINNLSYHIFYYLVLGASKEEREQLGLEADPSKYRYLDASTTVIESFKQQSMNKSNLSESLQLVKQSLESMSIAKEQCDDIFLTLAAILHLGNIEFEVDQTENEQSSGFSKISDHKASVKKSLSMVSKLLGYPEQVFKQSLLNRNLKGGGRGSVYCRPMEVYQSEQTRDALSKALYVRLFASIVEKINVKFTQNKGSKDLQGGSSKNNLFIGVLDIFGFENLSTNSLDQLLINFTNEKLQQQFNLNVFENEQKDYLQEGIPWSTSNFIDNKECIELVEKKSYGLLSLLDDECMMPKGSETTLLEKYNKQYHNTNQYYQRTLAKGTLGIKHFAGDVIYQTDSWLEKNRDSVSSEVEQLLSSSSNNLVKSLFNLKENNSNSNIYKSNDSNNHSPSQSTAASITAKASPPRERFNSGSASGTTSPLNLSGGNSSLNGSGSFSTSSGGGSGGNKKSQSLSVAGQFIEQLNKLISTINSTSVHYIRCIKPNVTMDCNNFNNSHVLSQLRNVGVLNTVKVRKMGYSYRRDFIQFHSRYNCILKSINIKINLSNNINHSILCKEILENVNSQYKNNNNSQIVKSATITTTPSKPSFQIGKTKIFISDELYIFLEKKRYDSLVDSVLKIQSFFKMIKIRNQYKRNKDSSLFLQTLLRSHRARKDFNLLVILENKRKEDERKKELERQRKEEEERQKELERQRREEKELEKKRKEEEEKEQERKRKEEEKELERQRKEEEKEQERKKKEERELEKKRKEEEKKKKKNDQNQLQNAQSLPILDIGSTSSTTTTTTTTTTSTPTNTSSSPPLSPPTSPRPSTPSSSTSSPSTKKQILFKFNSISNLLSKSLHGSSHSDKHSKEDNNNNGNNVNNSNANGDSTIIVSSDSSFGPPTPKATSTPTPPPPPPLKTQPVPISSGTENNSSPNLWSHRNSPNFNGLTREKSRARIGRLTIRSASPLDLSYLPDPSKNDGSPQFTSQSLDSVPTIPPIITNNIIESSGGINKPIPQRNISSSENSSLSRAIPQSTSKSTSTSLIPTTPTTPTSLSYTPIIDSNNSNEDSSTTTSTITTTTITTPISTGHIGESIEEKNKRFRIKIINELIETERDYVRDLNIVVEVFLNPIREKQLLSAKDVNALFSNIEILYSINMNVLKELEKERDPLCENISVGQTFLDMSHYLKMYTTYCSNQQNALKILEEEKLKNQPFREYLEFCMNDSVCRGLPLNSFIIKPVQRICKYPLLIKETIKFTPDDHPDKPALEEVDKKISDIVQSINEAKRTLELFQKIVDLQNSIDGLEDTNLMEQGRTLLMEGTVSAVKELNSEDSLSRTLFLFNNLILICSFGTNVLSTAINQFKTKKLKLKAKIPISDSRLIFVSDTDSVKYALEIVNIKEDSNYILCFNNDQDRNKWFKQIKALIQEQKLSNAKKATIGNSRLIQTTS
ncbi:hypothetical protein RB653_003981 [Dictyostelium firmibasis]|uniref:Uncharacterized protein n=1 Tax=Dictyostelium firmibasis TaxID=79012 RepID=A0AAN7U5G3_9MYCE